MPDIGHKPADHVIDLAPIQLPFDGGHADADKQKRFRQRLKEDPVGFIEEHLARSQNI
jgi:hypothetical protein